MSSIGSASNSIHGERSRTGPGASPSGQRRLATIVCIQVVPHLGGVQTKTSPGRGSKPAQRRLSATAVRYGRSASIDVGTSPLVERVPEVELAPERRVVDVRSPLVLGGEALPLPRVVVRPAVAGRGRVEGEVVRTPRAAAP